MLSHIIYLYITKKAVYQQEGQLISEDLLYIQIID